MEMKPLKFRKLPVIIEAIQWTGKNFKDVQNFCTSMVDMGSVTGEGNVLLSWPLMIPTLEGNRTAVTGDWIIKGVRGEFYPCKPDIFEMTYKPDNRRSPALDACGTECKHMRESGEPLVCLECENNSNYIAEKPVFCRGWEV